MDCSIAEQLRVQKQVSYAKRGLALGFGSGMGWALNNLFLGLAMVMAPYTNFASLWAAPIVIGALNDGIAAVIILIYNTGKGKYKEYFRTLKIRPGKFLLLASLFGGPLAGALNLVSIAMCGPVYALAITSIFPAFAAVFSAIFLKEKVAPRVYLGIALCITGSVFVGYVPPEGNYPHFYLGILMAFGAALGWAIEIVLAAFGTECADPEVCSGIREAVSFIVYFLITIPLLSSYGLFFAAFNSPSFKWIFLAATIVAFVYIMYYKAINMTGAARASGLSVTYAFWGVVFGWIFFGAVMTTNLVIGALIITVGALLICIHPKELTNLRKVC